MTCPYLHPPPVLLQSLAVRVFLMSHSFGGESLTATWYKHYRDCITRGFLLHRRNHIRRNIGKFKYRFCLTVQHLNFTPIKCRLQLNSLLLYYFLYDYLKKGFMYLGNCGRCLHYTCNPYKSTEIKVLGNLRTISSGNMITAATTSTHLCLTQL